MSETSRIVSYKAEALRLAKPGQGELIINRTAKTKQDRIILDREIKQAEWIINTLGGNIELPDQRYSKNKVPKKTPDFIWNNSEWELKILTNGGARRLQKILRRANKQTITKNTIVDTAYGFSIDELAQAMIWTNTNKLLVKNDKKLVEYLIRMQRQFIRQYTRQAASKLGFSVPNLLTF
jgi:hypothetical protein